MKNFRSTFLLFFITNLVFSQSIEKYPKVLTNSTEHEIAPYLSMDGKTLFYVKKSNIDGEWLTQASYKKSGYWTKPVDFLALNKLPKLNLLGSFGTNPDATEILYTSKKTGGLGNYDLWEMKGSGTTWSTPANLGSPINTSNDELNPFYSDDNKTFYFTRKIPTQENGDIYYCQKIKGIWSQPKKITIEGQYFAVRIASDGKTMYLSQVQGDKTSIFLSKIDKGSYSKPVVLNKLPRNIDKFFSIDRTSKKLTLSIKENDNYDLCFFQPDESQSSILTTRLSINYSNPFKIEIIEGLSESSLYKGTSLKNQVLLNDKNYFVKFAFQNKYPIVLPLDCKNKDFREINYTPKPDDVNPKKPYLIAEYDAEKDIDWQKINLFVSTLSLNPETFNPINYKMIFVQKNISYSDSLDNVHIQKEKISTTKNGILTDSIFYSNSEYSNFKIAFLSKIKSIELIDSGKKFIPTNLNKKYGIYFVAEKPDWLVD